MPISQEEHCEVPMPVAVGLGRLDQPLDFSLSQVLTGYVIQRSGDGAAQLFDFRWLAIPSAALILPWKFPPKPKDCSYNAPFTDSYQDPNDRA